jgi:hypothetical protein
MFSSIIITATFVSIVVFRRERSIKTSQSILHPCSSVRNDSSFIAVIVVGIDSGSLSKRHSSPFKIRSSLITGTVSGTDGNEVGWGI